MGAEMPFILTQRFVRSMRALFTPKPLQNTHSLEGLLIILVAVHVPAGKKGQTEQSPQGI